MPTLRQGSSGPDVTDLQQKLKDLGFDPKGVDGHFGPGTRDAVMDFQQSKGLQADGLAGPNTLAALQSEGSDTAGSEATTDEPLSSAIAGASGSSSPTTEGSDSPTNEVSDSSSPAAGVSDPTSPAAPPQKLNENDFQAAAALLKCDVPAIKAVAAVESAGDGFLSDGRVKILFEGHKFYKYTNGAYAQTHPTICYKTWTKAFYSKGKTADVRGAGELARLEEAMALDRTAALKSASYGKFQIMGFNFEICGFKNVDDFYAAMQVSEGEHLKAFCNFITSNSLDGALRNHQWAKLAQGYNGDSYKENQYDTKLANAYAKYSKP